MGESVFLDNENTEALSNPRVIISGSNKNVYGTYVHGIFDKGNIAETVIQTLAKCKGITIQQGEIDDYQSFKEKQYDKLADTLREYLNMEEIYGMLRDANI